MEYFIHEFMECDKIPIQRTSKECSGIKRAVMFVQSHRRPMTSAVNMRKKKIKNRGKLRCFKRTQGI